VGGKGRNKMKISFSSNNNYVGNQSWWNNNGSYRGTRKEWISSSNI
jgi:hypothetical protein